MVVSSRDLSNLCQIDLKLWVYVVVFSVNLSLVDIFIISPVCSGLYVLLRVKLALWRCVRNGSNIPSIFAQTVKRHPNKLALIYEATGETWTFTQLDEVSNSVAQWARSCGWVSGDVVAIFMESRPLQVALWLGLAKVGVESALINFNLRHDSLLHCVGVSASRAIVFGAELVDGKKVTSWRELIMELVHGLLCCIHGGFPLLWLWAFVLHDGSLCINTQSASLRTHQKYTLDIKEAKLTK